MPMIDDDGDCYPGEIQLPRLQRELADLHARLDATTDALIKVQAYGAGVIERQDASYRALVIERDQLKRERDAALAEQNIQTRRADEWHVKYQEVVDEWFRRIEAKESEAERLRNTLKDISTKHPNDLTANTTDMAAIREYASAALSGESKGGDWEAVENVIAAAVNLRLAWDAGTPTGACERAVVEALDTLAALEKADDTGI